MRISFITLKAANFVISDEFRVKQMVKKIKCGYVKAEIYTVPLAGNFKVKILPSCTTELAVTLMP